MTGSIDFLGRGWGFPPTFVATAHTVAMTEAEQDIYQSLEILVSTGLGERVMLPEYGCNLEDMLFEPMDTATQTLLFDRVRTAILYYEPRIEIEDIRLQNDRLVEGVLLIEVLYRVRATNSRFNFVYPFYKNEGSNLPDPI
jgi:uncharacterized protein